MSSNFYVRDLCNQLHKLDINEPSIDNIKHTIQHKCSIPIHYQQLWHNGKLINNNTPLNIAPLSAYNEITLSLSLHGGKGGFGSMLRAAGKLNKTTNKSAMRDLSGRRYRFVEQENEMREWIKQQKTNKQMSEHEIQNDFRHIKQYGTLPEKRMCHRGIHCKYKYKCKFRHPDDIDQDTLHKNKKKTSQSIPTLHHQTDEEMRNALLMGKINAKQNYKHITKQKAKTKKMIPLFGGHIHEQDQEQEHKQIHENEDNMDNMQQILHECHTHKLKWMMRDDCDFIICDVCNKQYKGPSWHCGKNCDFDACDDCVIICPSKDKTMDKHLSEYNKECKQMKQIQQRDQTAMNIKSFSNNICRKRKRKERKLNLLGLENNTNVKKNLKMVNSNSDNMFVDDKRQQVQRLRGEVEARNVNDPNEILIDTDLLFPLELMSGYKGKKKGNVWQKKGDIDLSGIDNVEGLKVYGLDKLKMELQLYGLKCGGTLQQRADRLFLLKDKSLMDLPRSCFVSKKKKKLKKPPRKKQKIVE